MSGCGSMDAVFPAAARARRRPGPRLRHRTTPVTFAEIKEVDEEAEESEESHGASATSVASVVSAADERRRGLGLADEGLARQFADFRRRRARRDHFRELDELASAASSSAPPASSAAAPFSIPARPASPPAPAASRAATESCSASEPA